MVGERDFLRFNRTEASARKDAYNKGYRNADDIGVTINRKTKLNSNYAVKLVVFIATVILLRFPGMAGEMLVIGHGVYYGGKLLRMITRWTVRRAKKEMGLKSLRAQNAKK